MAIAGLPEAWSVVVRRNVRRVDNKIRRGPFTLVHGQEVADGSLSSPFRRSRLRAFSSLFNPVAELTEQ